MVGTNDGREKAPKITVDTSGAQSPMAAGPTKRSPDSDLLAVPNTSALGRQTSEDTTSPSVLSETVVGLEDDENPLKPDPGKEDAYKVANNMFAFTPGHLDKMFQPKSLAALKAMGGIEGLEKGLQTDIKAGLSVDEGALSTRVAFADATGREDENKALYADVAEGQTAGHSHHHSDSDGFIDRRRVFGVNRLPERAGKTIFQLMWIAFNDKILILLSCAAAISLALGLYQTFGVKHEPGEPQVEWVEGVAIIVAIVIVVLVGAGNDWQKERQFVRLNKKKEDRVVNVVRSGKTIQLSVYDVLVGDVVHLEPGDLVPVDGVFIAGHSVKCDESSATGESDALKKVPASEVFTRIANGEDPKKLDPFILSGSKVLEGTGTFLVTNVGEHSGFGKTMMALREETEATPLQMKLNNLAEGIAKLGGASALLLFVVLLIKFLAQLKTSNATGAQKGQNFMRILITAITVVVVAVPEGLPLAVTLALAFATTRMLKDNNLVRILRACETSGNATTICSDKTGTLTQNRMTVVAGTLGTAARFGDAVADKTKEDAATSDGFGMKEAEFANGLSAPVKDLLIQSIVINSTAFEGEENGKPAFIGSKTETALLEFGKNYLGVENVSHIRESAIIAQAIPFDSGRKCMGSVVKLANGTYRMYVKGASEILLARCTKIIRDGNSTDVRDIDEEDVKKLNTAINAYASRSLRTIGMIYRDFPSWPPPNVQPLKDDPTQADFGDVFDDMTFFVLVGIQDPLRPGVTEAVADCIKAGIFVRMVTGDNIVTARAIATECGIYTPGGVVMEGPRFRQLTKAQMDQVIPRLQVLARSSPDDKRILVKRLKELGETVAVTGDGTNDGPALKMADVGFSMGIAGTEVAKEASAIILMDDNFASIIKAIMWGRAVNDAVKKFLQFQLTVNITAVLVTFISAVASSTEESVLSAVQLLWVNLIMDTFAALALATDPPQRSILDRKPEPKKAPLITLTMWKMIIGQAIYQLVVTFLLHFAGRQIFDFNSPEEREQLKPLVFNTFVWLQIFNQYNNRRLDNKLNILEGVTHNWFFIIINIIMVGGQVMIMFVGGHAFHIERKLNGVQWAISIIIGALSLPVGVVIRLIPDHFIQKLLPSWMHHGHHDDEEARNNDRFQWNEGIELVRDELTFLKKIRGGRLNQLRFSRPDFRRFLPGSRSASSQPSFDFDTNMPPGTPLPKGKHRSRSNSAFAAAAMVPSIVAGSIGGWSPIERPAEDALQFNSKGDLENEPGVDVHPDTKPDDPVIHEPTANHGNAPSQNPDLAPSGFTEGQTKK
ncbi:calcium-translocating P-type ATPase [Ascobolus immersus RN42]|uniref:Calcium-transporting ATPase n=1 Tax=Ascobolus immersus RN42 TaxID=1160509 RepID=A0A3N4IJP9_ASCIM|nr:calcium-translocating P-type ATPase [Ascobolus immersus RN42]